ncbi:MAG TPA: tetratricopeptide repeat protein [Terriglobales bacterium]|nr:tetratricopeptide repeat protein [Terriglobales bacterium]
MAFGFGFNKQKVLSAAEKFVQQGKLQNAISEYEKVLKADAKDLTVMNTVGDLYARLGENDKAADCFKNVGDAYASQGFTVKAIAMYKKLGKLKSSTESVLRLAELYTQQGLFNDARAQYLQVAEDFLKSGKTDQAVRIFQKTLEMDPENVQMRMRLAEAYIKMGKKDDAWQLLSTAAEAMRTKGQLAAANEILQRMLKLDPENSYALILRGRASVEAGDFPAAIDCLSKVPDLDNNVDGLRALFHAYLQSKRFDDASTLAAKLANVHDDISAIFEYATALTDVQRFRDALKVYNEFCDRLLRTDSAKLFECVRTLLGYVKDDTELLEMVLAIFEKGGETTQFTEMYELLAHGYVQAGELEKARTYYQKLMHLEPANQMHASNYQQITDKLGTSGEAPHLITPEEGASMIDELEANAPFVEQIHEDEVSLAVKAALTDAELFISYNMPAKALDPLIAALPKAPRDLRLNQKLAALHTKAGRFAEAAVCCRTLESIYHDSGHADEARRYSELAAKYEQRGGSAVSPVIGAPVAVASAQVSPAQASATQEFEIAAPAIDHSGQEGQHGSPEAGAPHSTSAASGVFFGEAPAQPAPVVPAVGEFSVAAPSPSESESHGDWEQDFAVEAPAEAAPSEPGLVAHEPVPPQVTPAEAQPAPAPAINLDESIEEVRFYLGQGMVDHAEEALKKLEALAPGAPELAVLRLGLDSAKQTLVSAEPAVSIEESTDIPTIEIEAEPEPDTPVATLPEPSPVPTPATHVPVTPQPWPVQSPAAQPAAPVPAAPVMEAPVPEPVAPPAPVHEEVPAPPQAAAKFGVGTLDAFVADLEASLGNDFVTEETPAPEPPPVAHARAVPAPVQAPAPPPTRAQAPAAHTVAPVARAAAASASVSPAPVPAPPPPPAIAPQKSDSLSVDLSSMFGELKQELEHDAATADEDPETHYNLGVAFREMGLLDEAIGELQKVCQSIDRGHPFPHVIQTYTWLAQCFIDKGVPEVAARWYEKALKIPTLDQESRTALHYELASALETAGNKSAALNSFLEVYSANIDYRDVAERIKALRS